MLCLYEAEQLHSQLFSQASAQETRLRKREKDLPILDTAMETASGGRRQRWPRGWRWPYQSCFVRFPTPAAALAVVVSEPRGAAVVESGFRLSSGTGDVLASDDAGDRAGSSRRIIPGGLEAEEKRSWRRRRTSMKLSRRSAVKSAGPPD